MSLELELHQLWVWREGIANLVRHCLRRAGITSEQDELRMDLKRLYRCAFVQGSIETEAGEEYRQLNRQIATLTKTLEQELKKEYRQDYFYCIHNEELE
jgi:transposase